MILRALLGLLLLAALPVQAAQTRVEAGKTLRVGAGETLRVGVNTLPVSLGNPFRGNGRPSTLVWNSLFDGLTQLAPDGKLIPALALRWAPTGPTGWRFELRPGVRYANGRVFDAAAAARVIGWLLSPDGRRTVIGNEIRLVKSVRATGPLTLELTTSEPDPILPKRLVAAMMVEPDLWERLGPEGFALKPVGTGPYVMTGWDQRRRRAQAVRNPHSWRPVGFGAVTWVELPEAAVRTQALLSGDVDLSPIEIEEMDRLTDRRFPVVTAPSMSVMSVAFVTVRDTPHPVQDVRVRRALNYAVDKEALAKILLRGLGRASGQPAAHVTAGFNPAVKPYRHDPALARRMLAEAGYAKGFDLEIEIQINAFPADSLIYQSVAHDLRQVGIRPVLRTVTFADYLRKLARNGWAGDAFGASWNGAPYNDITRALESFSCKRPNAFFCDKALATALTEASEITDDSARAAAMAGLVQRYHDAAPALFLVEQVDMFAHRPGLAGVRIVNRVPALETITERSRP
ncbi:ABC transporter substrate-binding protein [Polymorphobacter sp.]|uniref:ABC transporter substrate-binding protein n=1 Tax=Polymorphobacter sp. TaxID=1909290 RepID=UPI003F6FE97F